jgi:hypothetical protein
LHRLYAADPCPRRVFVLENGSETRKHVFRLIVKLPDLAACFCEESAFVTSQREVDHLVIPQLKPYCTGTTTSSLTIDKALLRDLSTPAVNFPQNLAT